MTTLEKTWLLEKRKQHLRSAKERDVSEWEETIFLKILHELQRENRRLKTELAARRPA